MPPIRKHQPIYNNHRIFDPWNSSSSGHQRGESGTGTAWRRTREEKLALQFSSCASSFTPGGHNGGIGNSSGGGCGSDGEWVWMNDHPSLGEDREEGKERGQRDIRDMFHIGKGSSSSHSLPGGDTKESSSSCLSSNIPTTTITTTTNSPKTKDKPQPQTRENINHPNQTSEPSKNRGRIFTNLTIYLNAASSPLISDHALRRLLVAHGASLALSVSRRVTHIIVGNPNTSSTSSSTSTGRASSTTGRGTSISGAGGGLAATKLQKEIAKAGCRGFKVVNVEWVLESIKAGKRVSEARFAMDIAARGQRSVLAFV